MRNTSWPHGRALLLGTLLLASHAAPAGEGPGFIAAVENTGLDCAAEPVQATPQAGLPDPFAGADGQRISTRAQWRCQRQQTLHALEQQVYGSKGPAPEQVSGSVSPERIEVEVRHGGRSERFSARVQLPPSTYDTPEERAEVGVTSNDEIPIVTTDASTSRCGLNARAISTSENAEIAVAWRKSPRFVS